MPRTRRRNKAREQFLTDTIAAWQESGLSVRAYCAAGGVCEATFFARRRRKARRAPDAAPIEPNRPSSRIATAGRQTSLCRRPGRLSKMRKSTAGAAA